MGVRFRPLRWEGASTPAGARRSRWTFKAPWSSTLELLDRELGYLDARDVVIEADFTEVDIRLDGWPRANARQPQHPGVRVAFDSKHGALVYATDTCAFWQHNLRSVGLGLEALRAVDRYGVTSSGEQYRGWRQIGAGSAIEVPPFTTAADAWRHLQMEAAVPASDVTHLPGEVSAATVQRVTRRAQAASHPDRGGDPEAFRLVQAATELVLKGRP